MRNGGSFRAQERKHEKNFDKYIQTIHEKIRKNKKKKKKKKNSIIAAKKYETVVIIWSMVHALNAT